MPGILQDVNQSLQYLKAKILDVKVLGMLVPDYSTTI
jgi:hypothetical protein